MVHIMNYKLYVYVFSILLSIYALTGINFEKITRKNKVIEIRIFIIIVGRHRKKYIMISTTKNNL